jgi:hypothetical protein
VSQENSKPIVSYSFSAENHNSIIRTKEGILTFLRAPKFDGTWDNVPEYRLDSQDFIGGYGATREYPGADVFSVRLKFAWSEDAFHFRADVTDPVHFNVYEKDMLYQGDSIQLALDPLLRQENTNGSTCIFNAALTQSGPELFRFMAPVNEADPLFTPPESNVSMGSDGIKIIEREHGLVYQLTLPWRELANLQPEKGTRMGIYFLAKNNNGNGLIDALQWPQTIKGMWMIPAKWGVITLI